MPPQTPLSSHSNPPIDVHFPTHAWLVNSLPIIPYRVASLIYTTKPPSSYFPTSVQVVCCQHGRSDCYPTSGGCMWLVWGSENCRRCGCVSAMHQASCQLHMDGNIQLYRGRGTSAKVTRGEGNGVRKRVFIVTSLINGSLLCDAF